MTNNYEHTRKRFYTVNEAATELNISSKSVRRLIDRGFFRPSKALRKILIPAQDIEDFYQKTK